MPHGHIHDTVMYIYVGGVNPPHTQHSRYRSPVTHYIGTTPLFCTVQPEILGERTFDNFGLIIILVASQWITSLYIRCNDTGG